VCSSDLVKLEAFHAIQKTEAVEKQREQAAVRAQQAQQAEQQRQRTALLKQQQQPAALQQQQIMMLECMISAYTLSALSLEGARSSERQMMASSWLIMTASLAFSYATPIKSMSPVRPLRSLFHPGLFISILGQAAIHLYCMVYAVNMAKSNMGDKHRMNGQCRDDNDMLLGANTAVLCEEAEGKWSDNGPCLQEVITFFKKVKAGEEVDPNDEDPLAEIMALWSTPFLPNLMNSTVFLVRQPDFFNNLSSSNPPFDFLWFLTIK
jgi:cation-transporting ATPase 13A1